MPIVTASDGRPTTATRKPLKAPPTAPTTIRATSAAAGDRQPALGAGRREHAAQPDHAGHREVDLAGDDDQRHRQRDQQDRRDVEEQVSSVSGLSKSRHCRGGHDDHHDQQGDDRHLAGEQRRGATAGWA